jgi:Cu(I)/Ag(I) efflux system membrane fusion protein
MNKGLMIVLVAIVAAAGGYFLGSWPGAEQNGGVPGATDAIGAGADPEVLYWVAPMDPNFRRDKPGKSPMGMDLVPVYAEEQGDGDGIRINPAMVNNLGVRTHAAVIRPLWRRIEATGYVGFDETRISHISLRTQGWIAALAVHAEGEKVSRGDLLFELYSPELVNAQKEFVQALQRSDDRLKRAADEKLRALGMIRTEIAALERTREISENISFVAPQDGIVSALSVREGMYVQPNTTIMSLADLSHVWLQAEVFESQAEWVAQGQAAEARMDYLPGVVFSGQVDFVYPVLDSKTRTLRVRLKFDNAEDKLKPNMYARVSIYGRLRPATLTIPREALIRAPNRDRVVISLGEGRFRVHEVLTGMESGDWVEILAGIEAGDEVVTSAQFLIDSEASLAGSIQRLDYTADLPRAEREVTAIGNGWIEDINIDRRRLQITHGPIDQLGWPGMTMEFDVDSQVELDTLSVGQDIRFLLRQNHSGEFVISQASLRDSSKLDSMTPSGEHQHD